GNGTSSAF
ncbi:3-deoxy-7-phosphoheptulonate synthase, partial [Vibrio parahaemolyticus VPTS-2010_2]